MKKAIRSTVNKMQRIFVGSKSSSVHNAPSKIVDTDGITDIEHGLEVEEDKFTERFRSGSSKTSQHRDEHYLSSDDEANTYIVELSEDKCSLDENPSDLEEGAFGALAVVKYQNSPHEGERRSIQPIRTQMNTYENIIVAKTTCGELEKKCVTLPIDLQAKISVIKETLLLTHPPYYDFCVISSEDDYELALQFKDYVSSSFGLAGCTLYDGFISLGSDLFESYEIMMNQSSKVFFFVTETFTSSAFCRRLQNGAVFNVLMSKAKQEREKCVPVFPNGFCRAPLALSGIAGLNPTQREVTRRSLENTYTPQLRQRRLVLDLDNYKKRCIEFESKVTQCITDYQFNLSTESASLKMLASQENRDSVLQNGNYLGDISSNSSTVLSSDENVMVNKNSETSGPTKSILGSQSNVSKPNYAEKESDQQKHSVPSEKENMFSKSSNSDKTKDSPTTEEFLDQFSLPEEILNAIKNEMRSNALSSYNISECSSVHVGPSIQVIINQAPGEEVPDVEQLLKQSFSDLSGNKTHSDGSDI